MNDGEVDNILKECVSFKPKELIISDLKWKYLVRAVVRSKNIMMIGPSGCAKTMAARCVAQSFFEDREEIVDADRLQLLQANPNIKIHHVEEI